jgi:hypothetical protein
MRYGHIAALLEVAAARPLKFFDNTSSSKKLHTEHQDQGRLHRPEGRGSPRSWSTADKFLRLGDNSICDSAYKL